MSSLKLINNIINQRGTPAFNSNTIANRPAAGYVGRIFISTDTFVIQRDNGTSWDNIGGGGITGSGAAGQVAFWTGASAQGGDNAIFWDNTNKRLGLGTTTPGVRLDIHGTGVIQQLNGTGTNNAFLDFQNAGTTQWRVGNGYNAAANDWQLIRNPTSRNVATIKSFGSLLWNSNQTTHFYGDAGDWEIYKVRGTDGGVFNYIMYVHNYNIQNNRSSGLWFNNTRGASIGSYSATLNSDVLFNLTAQGSTNSNFTSAGILGFVQTAAIGTYAPTNFFVSLATAAVPDFLNNLLDISHAGYTAIKTRVNVNNATDNALFELNVNGNTYTGGLSPTILTVGTNTTMARTATGYYCTATLTLTLPSAASINNVYWVIAASGVTVTVNRAGTDDILNLAGTSVTSITITSNQRAMFYVGGGTRTFLISQA